MAGTIDQRLAELAIVLPKAAAPAANYSPFVVTGNLVFVAGQLPTWEGEIKYRGKLGKNLSLDEGYQAARLCALNLIAQVREAADGDLDRVRRVVKLTGYVNATADFSDQPKVINGASELMAEVFGENGRHARVAVGCSSLPLGVAVEVDGIFEVA